MDAPQEVVPGPSDAFRTRAKAAGVRLGRAVQLGELTVDLDCYEVRVGARLLHLSARQVELLALLIAEPGRVWSREQLHSICWATASVGRRVDVDLCRIRAQLGDAVFRTVRNRGWAATPAGDQL